MIQMSHGSSRLRLIARGVSAACWALVVLMICGSCGSTAPSPPRASLSVTLNNITGSAGNPGVIYTFSITVHETNGVDATVSGVTISMLSGSSVIASAGGGGNPFTNPNVPSNGSATSIPVRFDDTVVSHPYASSVQVVVNFTDARGASSAIGTGTVPPISGS
jgi:hypothetical protein